MKTIFLLTGPAPSEEAASLTPRLSSLQTDGQADALILGGSGPVLLPAVFRRVFRLPAPSLSEYADPGAVAPPIAQWLSWQSYELIFLNANTANDILAPTLAVLLGGSCLCSLSKLEGAPHHTLTAIRSVCCLELDAQFSVPAFPAVLTFCPSSSPPEVPVLPRTPDLLTGLEVPEPVPAVSHRSRPVGENRLSAADLVFIAGRGAASHQAIQKLNQLAARMHACVGATRPVVFSGLAPLSALVGASAATIAPKCCLIFGASGSAAFLSGITQSKVLCAINSDPDAPIFSHCDYGLRADCAPLIDALLRLTDAKEDPANELANG